MAVSISDKARADQLLERMSPRDRELVALTIAGEIDPTKTRYGSPKAEREIASILQSIETRAAKSGKTPGQVIKERKQYSTWNTQKDRRTARQNYERHSSDILRAMSGYYSGRTQPAGPNIINYYSPSGMKGRTAPNWDFSKLRFEGQVGPHRFYSPFAEFGSRNMPRPRPGTETAQATQPRAGAAQAYMPETPTSPPALAEIDRQLAEKRGQFTRSVQKAVEDGRITPQAGADMLQRVLEAAQPAPRYDPLTSIRAPSALAPSPALQVQTQSVAPSGQLSPNVFRGGMQPSSPELEAAAKQKAARQVTNQISAVPNMGMPSSIPWLAGPSSTTEAATYQPSYADRRIAAGQQAAEEVRNFPAPAVPPEMLQSARLPRPRPTLEQPLMPSPALAVQTQPIAPGGPPSPNTFRGGTQVAYNPLSSIRAPAAPITNQFPGNLPRPRPNIPSAPLPIQSAPLPRARPEMPLQSPYGSPAPLPRARPEIAPAGVSAPALPSPAAPTATPGWLEDPLGALGGLVDRATAAATPALKKAERGLKMISNPMAQAALKVATGPGPVRAAELAGQTGGPSGFWNTFNHSPGSGYGPNVAMASFRAAQQFNAAQQARAAQQRAQQEAVNSTFANAVVGQTPSGVAYQRDPFGNQYGTAGYGTGVRGY